MCVCVCVSLIITTHACLPVCTCVCVCVCVSLIITTHAGPRDSRSRGRGGVGGHPRSVYRSLLRSWQVMLSLSLSVFRSLLRSFRPSVRQSAPRCLTRTDR